MKKKEKMVILVLLIITIVLVAIGIKTKVNSNEKQTANSDTEQNSEEEIASLDEEHVVTLEDGTRYSTSEKLKKTKSFDGITITDIQLTEKENKTVLLGTLTNTASETKGGYYVNIVLKDKNGNEITILRTYIDELGAGESAQLNTQTTLDYANAYDFSVEL